MDRLMALYRRTQQTETCPPAPLSRGNRMAVTCAERAEMLNRHFSSVGEIKEGDNAEAKDHTVRWQHMIDRKFSNVAHFDVEGSDKTIFDHDFSVDEIRRVTRHLVARKAAGSDTITPSSFVREGR